MAAVRLIKLDRDDSPMPTAADHSARRGREIAEEALRKKGHGLPQGSPVEIRKRTAAPADLEARIAKLAADVTSFSANTKIDEAMVLLAKRDPESTRAAGAILRSSPEVHDAYMARLAGERYEAPVAKAAEPDVCGHALTIKKHLEAGDHEGLRQLFHAEPESYATYGQMVAAGLTGAYAEVAKRQQDRNPSDVSEAEKAGWKKKIKAWLASEDPKGRKALAAARASRDPAFQGAWIDLVATGEIKVPA
jgi:hypothetical protein